MLNDFLNLLFPRLCVSCDNPLLKHEPVICTKCMLNLPKTNYHLINDNPVMKVFWGRVNITYATSFLKFTKKGNTQNILHQLKYKGRQDVGEFLGKWYAADLQQTDFIKNIDGIIPIPLHPKKEKKRGYNQSFVFAKGLSAGLNIPVENNLIRRAVNTQTQTKKAKYERWENVKNIFEINETEQIKNKNFIVVDDVITTGATMEACIQTLQEAGAKNIVVVTIAAA
ncbi:MAG: ComF family protein [Vicingaceae bacterium]